MSFGHEKLDVYRAAIKYVGWAHDLCTRLEGHRHAKDQLIRASQSIPLNIAEGNGKASSGDRRKFFEIARASALECAAAQDVLQVCNGLSEKDNTAAKNVLDRIVAMLSKLGGRAYIARESHEEYFVHSGSGSAFGVGVDTTAFDTESDTDSDTEQPIGSKDLSIHA